MTRLIDFSRARWISLMTLVWTLAGWCAGAMGQGGSPPIPRVDALPATAGSPSDSQREVVGWSVRSLGIVTPTDSQCRLRWASPR